MSKKRFNIVLVRATQFFEGDDDAARKWLNSPAPALNGDRPVDWLSTLEGTETVLDILNALEHGMYI